MRDRSSLLVLLFLLAMLGPLPLLAQGEEHPPAHLAGDWEGLGSVHFAVSCAPAVQRVFDRAVALLHSFGYEEARLAFQAVAKADPTCAMARWGEAMTWYHPVGAPPTAAELAAGSAAAPPAAMLDAKTDRGPAYVAP